MRTLLAVALTCIVLLPAAVFAQDPPPQQEPQTETPPKVQEEMVVTARKVEENVQTVPIAMLSSSKVNVDEEYQTRVRHPVADNPAAVCVADPTD